MPEPSVSPLLSLQIELQLEIIDYLRMMGSAEDLLSWGSTCTHFRSLLAPFMFRAIKLRNTEKSASSIDCLASGKYAHHVKILAFEGTAPGDEEEGFGDVDGIFPDVVERVLATLNRFPKLDNVSVKFDFDFEGSWSEGFALLFDWESEEVRRRAEQEEAWRALNTKVYAALAKNVAPVAFKQLDLWDLILKEASSFRTPVFRTLLGQLTHFTVTLSNDDSDSHYHNNVWAGATSFTLMLDELFLHHLSSLTHLDLTARFMPMRLYGFWRANDPPRMPWLKSFHLDGVLFGRELGRFLAAHAQTLEDVVLDDCHAGETHEMHETNTWATLFSGIAAREPTRLHDFRVEFSDEVKLFDDTHGTQADEDAATRAWECLKAHPERRLFSYSYLDDKYGFLGDRPEANLESFQQGADQRAYDDLMRIVNANSAPRS